MLPEAFALSTVPASCALAVVLNKTIARQSSGLDFMFISR
jgi:hypothetical protein